MKLVLLPGMDGTGDLFTPLVNELGSGLEPMVIAYPSDQALGYQDLVEVVRARLPEEEPFILFGESFSGPVAILLAASGIPNLHSLVLCCSFAANPHPQFRRLQQAVRFFPIARVPSMLSSFALLGGESTPEHRDNMEKALQSVEPAVLKRRVREILRVNVTDRLPDIDVPCLYLQARDDRVVPRSAADPVIERVPGARIVELAGPHFLAQTRPAKVVSAIQSLLPAAAS